MERFEEVEDIGLIRRLNKELGNVLRKELGHHEERYIGYPAGRFDGDVRFAKARGDEILWWHGLIDNERSMLCNFIGHGSPKSNATLNIDLQLNFPLDHPRGNTGGVFLRDRIDGTFVLAHRGLVTRGKARIPKSALFGAIGLNTVVATSSRGPIQVLPVAPVASDGLVRRMDEFARGVRETVQHIASGQVVAVPGNKKEKPPKNARQSDLDSELSAYFDEFSGSAAIKARGASKAFWNHGTIVRSLRDALPSNMHAEKSSKIDLLATDKECRILFEVKTGADLQSLYTAVGQLAVHALMLNRINLRRPVIKVLVAPDRPANAVRHDLLRQLGVRLVTWVKDGSEYRFEGLDEALGTP